MVSIGAKLRDERKKKGLTQQQLADKIWKDKSVISKIETGGEAHQVRTIKEIAEALGCTVQVGLVPRSMGADLLERPKIDVDNKIDLGVSDEAPRIHTQIIDDIKSYTSGEHSMLDTLMHIRGPRYRGLILADVQISLIDKILSLDLDVLTPDNALVVRVNDKDIAELVFDAAAYLLYEEVYYDDFGFESGYERAVVIVESTQNEYCGKFVFSEFFLLNPDKKSLLQKIQDSNKRKIEEAESYLDHHAGGFPFVCFYAPNAIDNCISLQYLHDEINMFPGDIVYAWEAEEATGKFLETVDDAIISDWLDENLTNILIDRLYYDDMYYDDLIDGNDIKKRVEAILGNNPKLDEASYKLHATERLTKDALFILFGKKNLKKIFVRECAYDVICYLPPKDDEIYRFVM